MTRRRKPPRRSATKPKPKLKPTPKPTAQPTAPAAAPVAATESDPRIRSLVERYCALAGVNLLDKGTDLRVLKLPLSERAHFRDRESVSLALSLDALARHPDAEIAVLGSPFLSHLIDAIRARAGRLSLGLIPPPPALDATGPAPTAAPDVPLRDGTLRRTKAFLAAHPIGRLVARVVLRAGAAVEEAVVESDVFDLSAGARQGPEVAALFEALEAQRLTPADPDALPDAAVVPAKPPEELIQLLLGNLQEKSAPRVVARRDAATGEVAVELDRLDRYFASILADKSGEQEVRTISAVHERRRSEEVRRHQVSVIVHPLQLVEARVLVQRVEWELTSSRGRRATVPGQRPLAGTAGWTVACPHCGRPPTTLVVCKQEHGACDACASRCSVCAEDFCADHGIALCRVDDQPACEEHARVCPSCRMAHCSAHEGVCAEGDHAACAACLEACGSCGRVVCNRHGEQSGADAPKGSRRLCAACVRYCEGGSGINELVGVDETAECASCGKTVCTVHQAVCVVDGQVHCSRHLRATDASQRLVCAKHRAACAEEPAALLASDEVAVCASCGRIVCGAHSGACLVDHRRHCLTHLAPLFDANGATACAAHRRECHVDGQAFSLDGVTVCPVCGEDACAGHRAACGYCGRHVCTADLVPPSGCCATCAQLVAIADPPEEVVAAVRAATGGAPRSTSGAWRTARDRTHLVVELDVGRRRRTVVTLRHGEMVAENVVTHTPG